MKDPISSWIVFAAAISFRAAVFPLRSTWRSNFGLSKQSKDISNSNHGKAFSQIPHAKELRGRDRGSENDTKQPGFDEEK